MSKRYLECPAYEHNICKYFMSKAHCAIARKDKKCLKAQLKNKSKISTK